MDAEFISMFFVGFFRVEFRCGVIGLFFVSEIFRYGWMIRGVGLWERF